MRNARFRPDGTLEAGAALRNQRQFWFLGLPGAALPRDHLPADRPAERHHRPGHHQRPRLRPEDPAVARKGPGGRRWRVGLQDAIGTGIYGGEYLVASKRFGPVDLSLGMGWGRLGTGADLPNPLRPGLGPLQDPVAACRPGRHAGLWQPGSTARTWRSSAGWNGACRPCSARSRGCAPRSNGRATRCATSAAATRRRPPGCAGEARSRLNLGLQWQPNPWLDAGVHFVHGTDALFRLSLRHGPGAAAGGAAAAAARPWQPRAGRWPGPARLADRPGAAGGRLPPARRRGRGRRGADRGRGRALPDPGPGRRPGRPRGAAAPAAGGGADRGRLAPRRRAGRPAGAAAGGDGGGGARRRQRRGGAGLLHPAAGAEPPMRRSQRRASPGRSSRGWRCSSAIPGRRCAGRPGWRPAPATGWGRASRWPAASPRRWRGISRTACPPTASCRMSAATSPAMRGRARRRSRPSMASASGPWRRTGSPGSPAGCWSRCTRACRARCCGGRWTGRWRSASTSPGWRSGNTGSASRRSATR